MNTEMIITAIEKAKKQSEENGLDQILMTIEFADKVVELLRDLTSVKPLLTVDGFICGKCGKLLSNRNEKLPEKCIVCGTRVGSLVK